MSSVETLLPHLTIRTACMRIMARAPLAHTSIVHSDVTKVFYPAGKERRQGYLNDRIGKEVSDFQWAVYDHIQAVSACHFGPPRELTPMIQIPSGRITTYGDVARSLATSSQAVGGALRVNPFCPLIPCHRVVAANGALHGFSGQSVSNWGNPRYAPCSC